MSSIWRMSSLGAVGLVLALAGPARAQVRPQAVVATVEPGTQPDAQQAAVDSQITAVSKAKLDSIKLLRNAQINVGTENGVVTVSGTVPSIFARDQAMDAVRGTPGVTRIDNQLRLDVASPQGPTRN